MTSTLVLIRHGQSEYNQKNIFTGWLDVALSPAGVDEAKKAQKALAGLQFDAVFVSALKRAKDTAAIVLQGQNPAVYVSDKALNERCYGELAGKNKDEMRSLYSAEQVEVWRRSFNVRPPGGESLKDTCDRVLPYFKREIEPRLKKDQNVLVSAHGNSIRALVKYLEDLSDKEIVTVEIPTARPIIYRFDSMGKMINKEML